MSTDTPKTNALLTAIADRDGELGQKNAPKEWVELARAAETKLTETLRAANALAEASRRYIKAVSGALKHGDMAEMRAASQALGAALAEWSKLKGDA